MAKIQTETPHDPAFVREWIKNDLESTQVWRSDKAAEYPNDTRKEKGCFALGSPRRDGSQYPGCDPRAPR